MIFNNEKTGKYIMILRKTKGYTQKALAERVGVSHQAVSQWERGETMPDIATLPVLAQLLGTTADAILSASEDGFEGFDEIIGKVNLVRQKKRDPTRDAAVREYLHAVLTQMDELISMYEEGSN